MKRERCDFHTHSLLSDGALLPIELLRRADVLGLSALAITDHVSFSNVERIVQELKRDCELADGWDIAAIPGVEVTHVPPKRIDEVVRIARKAGAEIVLVHGETIVEPVSEGTNLSAATNPDVDILVHPGMITIEEAEAAKENDVLIEITSRHGHCLANGHVARIVQEVGCMPIVNTDAHRPEELISQEKARKIAVAAGLKEELVRIATVEAQNYLLKRIGYRG